MSTGEEVPQQVQRMIHLVLSMHVFELQQNQTLVRNLLESVINS